MLLHLHWYNQPLVLLGISTNNCVANSTALRALALITAPCLIENRAKSSQASNNYNEISRI
jgi:hypothetical protein